MIGFISGAAGALIFPLGRSNHCGNAGAQSAVEVTLLETGSDFVVEDLFAKRVRQGAFQAVTGGNPHEMVLHKDKQDRAVVLAFHANFPGAIDLHGVVINGRVRLHLGINHDAQLGRGLPLKIFQGLV